MRISKAICVACLCFICGGSNAAVFGGGVRLFLRAPVMDTGSTFSQSILFEPYVSYKLNPQASIDLAFGYTDYDREPLNTGTYSTGKEVSGTDRSVSILAHGGSGSLSATLGFGNVWRSHVEEYTVYGSSSYELDYGEKKTSLMVISGFLFTPTEFVDLAMQLRFHSKEDFWVCMGIGFGY